jgi:hypothetical protein
MISAALEGHIYRKVAKLLTHLQEYFGPDVSLEEILLACEVVANWCEGRNPTITELSTNCGVPLSSVHRYSRREEWRKLYTLIDDPSDDRKKRIAPPPERRQQLAQQLLLKGLIALPSNLDG